MMTDYDRRTEQAVRRINLLRSIMVSIGGIPLLYIGDEWGMLNDYTYLTESEPRKMDAVHLSACGIKGDVINLINNDVLSSGNDLVLSGHQSVWLDIS